MPEERASELTVLLINLDRRDDKLKICKFQLGKLKVSNFTRISGVDGKVLLEELNSGANKTVAQVLGNDLIQADRQFIQDDNKMHVGCTLSHLKAYHFIIENNIEGPILVLEDDFVADGDAIEKTLEIAALLPSDWGIFYAGHCHTLMDPNHLTHNDYGVTLLADELVPCAHAYLLNGVSAAKALFDAGNTSKLELADFFAQKSELKRFIIYPFLFSQIKEVEADIKSEGGAWYQLKDDSLRQEVFDAFVKANKNDSVEPSSCNCKKNL